MIVALDTETYYSAEYSVKDMGYWQYTHHPQFDCYMLSIVADDGFRWCGHPKDFDWSRIHGATWLSHNVAFDEMVVLRLQELGIAPQDVAPDAWHDTADLAAYLHCGRSLKAAAAALLKVELSKDIRDKMKGKTYADQSPEDQEAWRKYALDDSEYCLRLFLEFGSFWPENERRLSLLNRKAAQYGVYADLPRVLEGIELFQRIRREHMEKIPWWDGTDDCVILSAKKLSAYCEGLGITAPSSVAEDSPIFEKWCNSQTDKKAVEVVELMRGFRKTNTMLKKLEAIKNRIKPDQTMPIELRYCGAHTGRYSGQGGVNWQNLNRDPFMGFDLRAVILPRPGHVLIASDYAQIEPRVLAVLAGNERLLSAVRAGYGIYEAAARAMSLWDGDKGTLKKTNPSLYQLVKAEVLGLGYGLGAGRFVEAAWTLAQVRITEEQAARIVPQWRTDNREITTFWKDLERGLSRSRGGDHHIELHSGRLVSYYEVKHDGTGWSAKFERGGIQRVRLWGGVICENCTQAVARDVLANAILNLDAAGYRTLFSVHDELILEVPKETAEADAAKIADIMRVPPEWMPELPLEVEYNLLDHYKK